MILSIAAYGTPVLRTVAKDIDAGYLANLLVQGNQSVTKTEHQDRDHQPGRSGNSGEAQRRRAAQGR